MLPQCCIVHALEISGLFKRKLVICLVLGGRWEVVLLLCKAVLKGFQFLKLRIFLHREMLLGAWALLNAVRSVNLGILIILLLPSKKLHILHAIILGHRLRLYLLGYVGLHGGDSGRWHTRWSNRGIWFWACDRSCGGLKLL